MLKCSAGGGQSTGWSFTVQSHDADSCGERELEERTVQPEVVGVAVILGEAVEHCGAVLLCQVAKNLPLKQFVCDLTSFD